MPWKFPRQPSPVPSCPACCPKSRSPRDNHTPNPRTELRPKSNAMTSSSRRRRKTHIHPVLNIVRNLSQHEPSLKPNPPPEDPTRLNPRAQPSHPSLPSRLSLSIPLLPLLSTTTTAQGKKLLPHRQREREEAKRNARLKHIQFNSHPLARSRIFSFPCPSPVPSIYRPIPELVVPHPLSSPPKIIKASTP